MAQETPRVFISYTAQDLLAFADEVAAHVVRMQWAVSNHRDWAGDGRLAVEACLDEVKQADIFVLLVAHRYGFVPEKSDHGDGRKSITWLEYECALQEGKPLVLLMLRDGDPKWPKERYELDTTGRPPAGLLEFRALVARRVVAFFDAGHPATVLRTLEIGLRRAQAQLGSSAKVLRGEYGMGFPMYRNDGLSVVPPNLSHLCDRSPQAHLLRITTQEHIKSASRRPLLLLIHGDASESHNALVSRAATRILPSVFAQARRQPSDDGEQDVEAPECQILFPTAIKPSLPDFGVRFRQGVANCVNLADFADDAAMLRELPELWGSQIVVSFEIYAPECGDPDAVLRRIHAYWRELPDIPDPLLLICLISVTYRKPAQAEGGIGRAFRSLLGRKPSPEFREVLARFEQEARGDARAPVYVLPELPSVERGDIVDWLNGARRWVKRNIRQTEIDEVLGADHVAPMEDVIDFLDGTLK